MTINGQVTGAGNLRKEDSGILQLNNTSNSYAGLTRIALGTIRIGVTGVIPDASGVEIAGGNLDLNAVGETAASLTGTGGALNGGNTLTVLTSGSASYGGAIQNATTLHMAGTGTQTISGTGDNANGWASVSSGTLVLGKTSTGSVHSVGRSFGTGLTISGGTAMLGGSGNDQIYLQTDVSQSTGVFDFNGRNEGFRGLTGTGGTVRNGVAETISIMTLGETTVAGNTFTYAGAIEDGSGTMELVKTGAGIQILSGTNTYTGYTTINGGVLRVQGSLANTPTLVSAAIGGNGSVGGEVSLLSGGGIAATISDWNGAAGTGFDDLAVQSLVLDPGPHTITIDTSALVNFAETTKTFPILTTTGGITGFDALDFTVSAPGFTGTGTWSVQQNSDNLEVVYAFTAYDIWATAKGLTLANKGKSQDPDNDGRTNLQEFAFDGDPLSGANDGKMVTALADPDGAGPETTALTLTLPVRTGAIFSGPGDLVSAAINDVIYHIQGSDDLLDFTSMNVSEISPALSTGLPGLTTGWSYRTFRSPGTVDEPDASDFLRAGVE
jgi:autotransporter-associated beta strand protein